MFKKAFICIFLVITSLAFAYSDQVVISQFSRGLEKSISANNYSLSGVTKANDVSIKAVESDDLSTTIDFLGNMGGDFTGSYNNLQFNFETAEKSVMIPVVKNTGNEILSGSFQLTQTSTVSGEPLVTYLIQDNIKLPVPISNFQKGTSDTGVKFTYTDSNKTKHLSAYKKQEFVVRIAKTSVNTDYDVMGKNNGIRLANGKTPENKTHAKSFLDGDENVNYVDFLVTADKEDAVQSVITDTGLSLKFMPGEIEVFGLPKGNYRLEVYSFRYSQEVTTKGNVVITKENVGTLETGKDPGIFTIGVNQFLEEGIDIINFSTSAFPKIKATILTIGTSTGASITVSENSSAQTINPSPVSTTGAIHIDGSGVKTIDSNGTEIGGLYYQIWEITYESSNQDVPPNDLRTVTYKTGAKEASTTYRLISSVGEHSGKPLYQTVFAVFKDNTYTNGTYEIDDRVMNKYSGGYSVKSASVGDMDIETLYRGVNSTLGTFNSSYNWEISQSEHNALIISKPISDSKGTFRNIDNKATNFTFYTTEWKPEEGKTSIIDYKEKNATSHSDTANFSWTGPSRTSYNTSLSEGKVIFRILKSDSDSETYRYKPEINEHPIKDSLEDFNAFFRSENPTNYFDVVFKAGEDGKIPRGDAVFNFSKNNTLQIVGLRVGDYKFQIYSLQNEDSEAQGDVNYDYKVLTYGETSDTFTMGLPVLETGEFREQNNIYLIDSVKLTSSLDDSGNPKKDVEVGFIVKAEEAIASLSEASNLIARKDEVSSDTSINLYTNNPVTEMWNNNRGKLPNGEYEYIKPVINPVLSKADKANFQYPLDIIFLIDNSGSMQGEIDSVKSGLDEFTRILTEKGYNVKFNLITFGPSQTSSISNRTVAEKRDSNALAIFEDTWFDDLEELKSGFDDIEATGGYRGGQENGAWAIHYGIKKLTENGRYLNRDFQIINKSSNTSDNYLASKKWLILLTDENMDTNNLTMDDETIYSSATVVEDLSEKMKENDITLTGIYHTDVRVYNLEQESLYRAAGYSNRVTNNGSDLEFRANINGGQYPVSKNAQGFFQFTMGGVDYEVLNENYRPRTSINATTTYYYASDSYKSATTNNNGTRIGSNRSISSDSNYLNYRYFTESGSNKRYYILDDSFQKVTSVSPNTTYHYRNEYTSFNLEVISWTGDRWLRFTDKLGNEGVRPSEPQEVFYTEFALQNHLGSKFNMYEMGATGGNVAEALKHSVSNIGIIQRWNLNYTSPFSANDGYNREVIFSLQGLRKITSVSTSGAISYGDLDIKSKVMDGTRIYNVPEQKIEAYFVNPNEGYRKLLKKDGKINLIAKARSQYKKEIDGVLQWVNYPIIKGTFVITGNYSNDGETEGPLVSRVVSSDEKNSESVVLRDYKDADGSTWYNAESNWDAEVFTNIFGSDPMNITVRFIAETVEDSRTVSLTNVELVEGDAPIIRDFKMTNVTLRDFMEELKDSSSKKIFDMTDSQVINKFSSELSPNANGAITVDSFTTDKKLNVKDGDKVLIEFIIDDESITKDSLGVGINYKQTPYKATGENISDSSNPYRTKWTVEIPASLHAEGADVNLVTNIELNITDDNNNKLYRADDGTKTPYYVNVFNAPDLLPNTTLVEPNNPNRYTGDTNTDYYNTKTVSSNKITGALAYLMAFEYDSSFADEGAIINPSTNGYGTSSSTKKWVSSLNGDFSFYEGKHVYDGKVYVINTSGAITELTHYGVAGYPSEEKRLIDGVNFTNVVDNMNIPTTNPSIFYVDTIAPVVTSLQLEKIADANPELNSGIANGILNGLIAETVTVIGGTDYKRPYKNGDSLTLFGAISEKNIWKTTIGGENILTDEGLGTITGTTFTKTGIAKSLGTNVKIDGKKDVVIYDKSGNKAENLTNGDKVQLDIVYDNRDPNALETEAYTYDGNKVKGIISGNTIETKYTRDNKLPLTSSTNGVPLSVVKVKDSPTALETTAIYGDVRKGTGNLDTIGYSVSNDGVYTPTIATYSYSGVKSTEIDDKIILDTEVGSLNGGVTLKNTKAEILADNLNAIFENNNERVGLGSYSIRPLSAGVNSMALGGNNYVAGTKMPLVGALYTEASSTSSNISGEMKFTFAHASGGTYKFAITLLDRLGNSKDIEYIVEIPNNVTIIGKTSGSTKQIETKVNNASSKIKVESRKE